MPASAFWEVPEIECQGKSMGFLMHQHENPVRGEMLAFIS